MYVSKFKEWFDGLVGFSLTSERFIAEAKHMDVSDKNIKRLIEWLQAAYNNGYEQGHMDATPDSEFGEGSVC